MELLEKGKHTAATWNSEPLRCEGCGACYRVRQPDLCKAVMVSVTGIAAAIFCNCPECGTAHIFTGVSSVPEPDQSFMVGSGEFAAHQKEMQARKEAWNERIATAAPPA